MVLDNAPKYTFGLKTNLDKPSNTPAPGDYCPEKAMVDNAPKYTFGLKTNLEKPSNTPGTRWVPFSVLLVKLDIFSTWRLLPGKGDVCFRQRAEIHVRAEN